MYVSTGTSSGMKITDFGLASIAAGENVFDTICGTKEYVGKEILSNKT